MRPNQAQQIDAVLKAVSDVFSCGVTPAFIASRRKWQPLADARAYARFFIRIITGLPKGRIAEMTGSTVPSAALYSCERVLEIMQADPREFQRYDEIVERYRELLKIK